LLGLTQGNANAADPAADFKKNILPILEDTCYDCHGEGTKKGDFALDKYPRKNAPSSSSGSRPPSSRSTPRTPTPAASPSAASTAPNTRTPSSTSSA
jgi:hypothetical protein